MLYTAISNCVIKEINNQRWVLCVRNKIEIK